MEPEIAAPISSLNLPLAGEGDFDFFSTWQRISGIGGLQHLAPIPHPSGARRELPALLEMREGGRTEVISSEAQWETKRHHLRENLEWLAGEIPQPAKSVKAKTIFETVCAGYVRRKIKLQIEREISSQILFQSNANGHSRRRLLLTVESESIPGYLCVPNDVRIPRPAVICLHQFNRSAGAREAVGLESESQDVAFADELARQGFVTLAFDLPGYGERKAADQTAAQQIVDFYRAHPRGSLLGRIVWEVSCAVNYLASLDIVDGRRIGCMGHLLGGIAAIFSGALDERIRAVVASAACATFRSQFDHAVARSIWCNGTGLLPIFGFFNPDVEGGIPIEYHEIVALIAPRPLFLCSPMRNEFFPREGLAEVENHLANLYAFLGHPERLSVCYPHYFIYFPPELREESYQWLVRFL